MNKNSAAENQKLVAYNKNLEQNEKHNNDQC